MRSNPTLFAIFFCLLGGFFLVNTAEATEAPGILVSAPWVHSRIQAQDSSLVLLQVGPEKSFDKGHIAGASFMSIMDFTHPDSHQSDKLIMELPDPEVFQAKLRERGVRADSRIVVYWADEWIPAATRLIFTLDWAGLGDRTSLLNGGLTAWQASGFELSTSHTEPVSGDVTVEPRDIIVDADWVLEHQHDDRYQLIDARAASFFDGVTEDRGAHGRIAGAGNLPWMTLVNEETLELLPREKLQVLLAEAGVAPGDIVVGYCHIGLFTTLDLFVARLFDHEVLLYDGAFQDWGSQRGLPTESGP